MEGNRSKAGMFHAGELLSATKLNALGQLAGYGTTKHSHSLGAIQNEGGTVYIEQQGVTPEPTQQFKVTIVDDEWFSITSGYATTSEVFGINTFNTSTGVASTEACDGGGTFNVGWKNVSANRSIEPQNTYTQVWYINSCNAYGSKKDAAGSNKLEENLFKPDLNDNRHVMIFLYRCEPGAGCPKLGVMSWPAYRNYFTNQGINTNGPSSQTYFNFGALAKSTIYFGYTQAAIPTIPGLYPFPAVGQNMWMIYSAFGLSVQLLAVYDKEEKIFMNVNDGHSNMIRPIQYDNAWYNIADGEPITGAPPTLLANSGWHSYFYTDAQAGFTGLKFESAPPIDIWQPPAGRTFSPTWDT